jgi:hypothetical protein
MRINSLDAARAELEAIRVWDLYFLLGETCSKIDFDAYCVRLVRRKEIVEEVYGVAEHQSPQSPTVPQFAKKESL